MFTIKSGHMSSGAPLAAAISVQVQALLSNESLSAEEKRKLMADLANSLLTANTEVKKAAAQLSLADEKKTNESNKFMDKYINLTKEQESIMNYNKKMMGHLQEIKKNTENILEQLKMQKDDYERRFEELMRKLEEEYNYDEKKCQTVAEENERLRARSDKISADIQAIETEYQTSLNSLRRVVFDGRRGVRGEQQGHGGALQQHQGERAVGGRLARGPEAVGDEEAEPEDGDKHFAHEGERDRESAEEQFRAFAQLPGREQQSRQQIRTTPHTHGPFVSEPHN